jgi:predicted MFS family arabinose efflux permease
VKAPAREAAAVAPVSLPRRIAWSAYATGFFCDSYTELFTLIVPLWAVHLGMTPLEIGILVGARAFLPFFLAIHGGVLIDRFGTRRVMIIASAMCLVLPSLFLTTSWLPVMLLLQTAGGLAGTWSWVGAQAQAIQVSNADTDFVSRFSFFARAGAMSGPVVIGMAWDALGPGPSFIIASLWGGVFLATSLIIPETGRAENSGQPARPFRFTDLLPRLSDYVSAVALTAIPAVAFVVAGSFVRASSANMQNSFYVVYLQEIDFPGTLIGTLIALTQAAAGVGTFAGGPVERVLRPQWAFIITVFLSVVFITITPLLGGIFTLLAIAVVLRGFFQGVSQPIMFTYLSRAVSMREQATSIGLRTTVNRLAVLVLPVTMGAVAEFWGVGPSFLVMGGLLLFLLTAITVVLGRRTRAKPAEPTEQT